MWLKSTLRWFGIILGSVLGIALIAAVVINVIIIQDLGKQFDVPGTAIEIPQGDAAIEEGARLAKLRGCNEGCHGDGSLGRVFSELPGGSRVFAPNIVLAAQNWPINDLERLVRHGVRPDGTSVILPMPSAMLYHLTDEDLGAIVAFLRSLDPGDKEREISHFNFIGRLMLFYFRQLEGNILSADVIDHHEPRLAPDSPDRLERGHYLAKTVCSECHGGDLRGSPDFGMPDLVVSKAYTLEDFTTLMRTGVPLGNRELELMNDVAVDRFAYFTDDEISDLHAYLQTLGTP